MEPTMDELRWELLTEVQGRLEAELLKTYLAAFEYPCHSLRYDLYGVVLKGPAASNLRKLSVEESEDGNLHVFTA